MADVVCPYWIGHAAKLSQEIASSYRPYPKPTQVS